MNGVLASLLTLALQGDEGAAVQSLSALPAVLACPPLLTALRPLADFLPPCPASARADLALCRATLTAAPQLQWRQVPRRLCMRRLSAAPCVVVDAESQPMIACSHTHL